MVTLDKIKDEYIMKEKWRNKLVKKGIKEEKRPAKLQTKAFSLHSNRSISNENSDFQIRTPFESRLFIMAKNNVLKKRKELQENHKHLQIDINKQKLQEKRQIDSKKPTFKLDLTKLLNHETLNSMNKMPNSVNTEIKKSKTSRFSYLFHEDELSFKDKFNTTTRKGDQKKNSFETLKSEEPKKISQGIKIIFERALEKLKIKKESNITNKSVEEENGMEKNKLQKFIQMMFQGKNNLKKNSEEKKVEMKEKNNIKSILSKESLSKLYLYNNSFQDRVRAFEEKKFETDRESKCGNIHVEKMKKKILLKNNSCYIKALTYFKKSKKKDVYMHH